MSRREKFSLRSASGLQGDLNLAGLATVYRVLPYPALLVECLRCAGVVAAGSLTVHFNACPGPKAGQP